MDGGKGLWRWGESVYSYKHIHILNALFNTGGKL